MNQFDQIHHPSTQFFIKSDSLTLMNLFNSTEIMPFWIADMDFKIAKPISDVLQTIVHRNIYAYEDNTTYLYNTLVSWFKKRHHLDLRHDHFIPVPNILTAISILIQDFTVEGDYVLVQTPVYHKFSSIITSTNRKVLSNPLLLENGSYHMYFEDLENKLREHHVKLMILCNPHNPVGRVWKKEELKQLLTIANKYKTRIISDEIHADIVYSKAKFNSILSFQENNHIALIGSPSKTFGMQSISNGYIYIKDQKLFDEIKLKIESLFLQTGNTLTNYATIAAYEHGEGWLNELLIYLEKTILWIREFLAKELPQIKLIPIEGTYQIWLDFRELNLNQDQLYFLLVKKSKIALAPGEWFGTDGIGFERMTIATPLSNIQTAFRNLKNAISN